MIEDNSIECKLFRFRDSSNYPLQLSLPEVLGALLHRTIESGNDPEIKEVNVVSLVDLVGNYHVLVEMHLAYAFDTHFEFSSWIGNVFIILGIAP